MLHRFWLPILLLWGDSALRLSGAWVDAPAGSDLVQLHPTSFSFIAIYIAVEHHLVRLFCLLENGGEGEYPYYAYVTVRSCFIPLTI